MESMVPKACGVWDLVTTISKNPRAASGSGEWANALSWLSQTFRELRFLGIEYGLQDMCWSGYNYISPGSEGSVSDLL